VKDSDRSKDSWKPRYMILNHFDILHKDLVGWCFVVYVIN
jgi:hypothetical protein